MGTPTMTNNPTNAPISRRSFLLAGGSFAALMGPRKTSGAARADFGVKHSFLALGQHTYIKSEDGETVWEWPENTRDGWVLPSGNILLVITRVKDKHGGRVLEVTRDGEVVFSHDGAQDEINTAQPLPGGGILLTEAGRQPRIRELDRSGKVRFELPLDCQTENIHLQSRMTRKLRNGNYLVPQMGEKEVREYTRDGTVVWRAQTPHWPFTAIRLPSGASLVTATRANRMFEFDGEGRVAWQLSNDDLPADPLNGLCGAQRLPNGNTVVTSYQAKAKEVKLTEVTRDKKIVWSYRDELNHGIHHFQILTTNGKKIEGTPLK